MRDKDTEKHMDTHSELNNHIGHMLFTCGGERFNGQWWDRNTINRVESPARWAKIRTQVVHDHLSSF